MPETTTAAQFRKNVLNYNKSVIRDDGELDFMIQTALDAQMDYDVDVDVDMQVSEKRKIRVQYYLPTLNKAEQVDTLRELHYPIINKLLHEVVYLRQALADAASGEE